MSQQMYGPQGPQQPQPPMGAPMAPAARNGLGIAALTLGIIGTCAGLIPFLFWLAGILGVLALVLGLSGRGRAKRGQATNKGVATTGAVLGLASLILSVVGVVLTFNAVDDAVNEISKSVDDASVAEKNKDTSSKGEDKDKEAGSGDEANTFAAGDIAAYEGGIEVYVSNPSPYTPDEFSIGHEPGNKAYKVTVTIVNSGDEKFDTSLVTVDARAGKDGKTAESIFDDKVGEGFSGTILPGKTASADYAFDAPSDAASLDVEVSPGWDYDSNQWNLKP